MKLPCHDPGPCSVWLQGLKKQSASLHMLSYGPLFAHKLCPVEAKLCKPSAAQTLERDLLKVQTLCAALLMSFSFLSLAFTFLSFFLPSLWYHFGGRYHVQSYWALGNRAPPQNTTPALVLHIFLFSIHHPSSFLAICHLMTIITTTIAQIKFISASTIGEIDEQLTDCACAAASTKFEHLPKHRSWSAKRF